MRAALRQRDAGELCCGRYNSLMRDEEVVTGLHSPERQLIELRMQHADLNAQIDRLCAQTPFDELLVRRLKKQRLALKDLIAHIEAEVDPPESA